MAAINAPTLDEFTWFHLLRGCDLLAIDELFHQDAERRMPYLTSLSPQDLERPDEDAAENVVMMYFDRVDEAIRTWWRRITQALDEPVMQLNGEPVEAVVIHETIEKTGVLHLTRVPTDQPYQDYRIPVDMEMKYTDEGNMDELFTTYLPETNNTVTWRLVLVALRLHGRDIVNRPDTTLTYDPQTKALTLNVLIR